MPRVGCIWPDGTTHTASSWSELEDVIRREQFDRYDRDAFREEMALRSMNWSGTEIDETGTSEAFFHELARAGMLVLFRTEGNLIRVSMGLGPRRKKD